jgi:glycosyltransferase involved in cell wall biosynthesis
MNYLATILICTHNPRMQTFARALAALKAQAEPANSWELLIIDNCSREPLAGKLDLSWHPNARVLSEPRVGKTHATLLGFAEARSPLIITVDDDNLLCPNYVSDALAIEKKYPFLGAWGGVAEGEFESPPPSWALSRLDYIAVRADDCPRPVWTNEYFRPQATPIGAGLCIRKIVTTAYAAKLQQDVVRQSLGPTGSTLSRCEDIDLAYTAIDIGLGIGRFPNLELTHVIPKERLNEVYFLDLVESAVASNALLKAIRGVPAPRDGLLRRLVRSVRSLLQPAIERRFDRAYHRGIKKGLALARKVRPYSVES